MVKYSKVIGHKPIVTLPSDEVRARQMTEADMDYVPCEPVNCEKPKQKWHTWIAATSAAAAAAADAAADDGITVVTTAIRGGKTTIECKHLLYTCACCGMPCGHLSCSRCRVAVYCDKACQKKHWKAGHKEVCSCRVHQ
jgi:hypothetical protein